MKTRDKMKKKELPGYPLYPEEEDIYANERRDPDINPDDKSIYSDEDFETRDPEELDFTDILESKELDVPGSEYDDMDEEIGSEDEENNYYSLGGDNFDNN